MRHSTSLVQICRAERIPSMPKQSHALSCVFFASAVLLQDDDNDDDGVLCVSVCV